jgi:carbonic anhydrase
MKSDKNTQLCFFVLFLITFSCTSCFRNNSKTLNHSHSHSHNKANYKNKSKIKHFKSQNFLNLNKKSNNSNNNNNNSHNSNKASQSRLISKSPTQLSKQTRKFIKNTLRKKNIFNNNYDKEVSNNNQRNYKKRPDYSNINLRKTEVVKNGKVYEGWLTLQSEILHDSHVYPAIPGLQGIMANIPVDQEGRIVNKMWKRDSKDIPSKYFVWSRLKDKYLYFTNDKSQFNTLVYLYLEKVKAVENLRDDNYCMKIKENENVWTMCAESRDFINKWVCLISATVRQANLDDECSEKKLITQVATKIVERKITQPFIIIPKPQKYCNTNWDYQQKGDDWECMCKTGLEQSPIDLPSTEQAVSSQSKPIFDYKKVGPNHTESGLNGKVRANSPMEIVHNNWALTIFHNNFGKIVSMDGSVFQAQEIRIHTPSEHTINGQIYPLEIQVVHNAMTKGDFGKKAVLSFLFKGKAGIYNKFMEALDFFSLPNPDDRSRKIFEQLYIPNLLLTTNDMEISLMSFSFYTYQGSLTHPPCQEGVIHYVASEPLEISMTTLELLKEALRVPDKMDSAGNIIRAKSMVLANARKTQNLNGRAVFHYDHVKYGFPTFKNSGDDAVIQPKGHFEKQDKESTEYIFVEGSKPSGMPGAILVSDQEANS